MPDLIDETIKERRIKVTLYWKDLRDLLLQYAMEVGKVGDGQEPFNTKVVIDRLTEGSPEYSVDKWIARVEVILKL